MRSQLTQLSGAVETLLRGITTLVCSDSQVDGDMKPKDIRGSDRTQSTVVTHKHL